jgi:hypothetical protein
MLHAVLEEAERAVVKAEQHAHTIALLVAACWIVAVLAVATEASDVSSGLQAERSCGHAARP